MAKQYIPGVSGLLTEPNPADSPSNTLSEADNVVVEQGGKVQARHGFNIVEEQKITDLRDNTESLATDYGARDSIPNTNTNYSGFNYENVLDGVIPGTPGINFKYYKNDGSSVINSIQTLSEVQSLDSSTPFYDDASTDKNIPENTIASTHYVTNLQDNLYISYSSGAYTGLSKEHSFIHSINFDSESNFPYPLSTPLTYTRYVRRNGGVSSLCVKIQITSTYAPFPSPSVTSIIIFNLETNTIESQQPQFIEGKIDRINDDFYKISATITPTQTFATSEFGVPKTRTIESIVFEVNNTQVTPVINITESVRQFAYSDQLFNPKTPLQYDPFIPYSATKYIEGIQFTSCVSLGNNQTELFIEHEFANSITTFMYDTLRVGDRIKFRSDVVGGQQLDLPANLQYDTYYTIINKNMSLHPSFGYGLQPTITIEHDGVDTVSSSGTWRALAICPFDMDLSYASLYQNPNFYYGIDEALNKDGAFFNNATKYNRIENGLSGSSELDTNIGIFSKLNTNWILGYPTKIPISDTLLESESAVLPKLSKIKLIQRYPLTSLTPLPNNLNYGDEYRYLRTEKISGITYIVLDVETDYVTDVQTPCRIEVAAFPIYISRTPTSTTASDIIPRYIYPSQYNRDDSKSYLKFVEYQNSSDEFNTIFIAKQTYNSYGINRTGLFKNDSSLVGNRYYLLDNAGNLQGYKELPYTDITNVFSTKESLYFQTENGLGEMNVDDVARINESDKLFDLKWPAFPEITFDFTTSDIFGSWFKSGTYFAIKMTFFRELGYSDKESQTYESEPSVPIIVYADNKNSIPRIYLDFKYIYENKELYKVLNEFTKSNNGRKFGIKIYRTKAESVDDVLQTEYYLAYLPINFNSFMASVIEEKSVYKAGTAEVDYTKIRLRESNLVLEVGDYVSIATTQNSANKVQAINDIESYDTSGFNSTKIVPYKYSIKNNPSFINQEIRGFDYKTARLQVASKFTESGITYYTFKTTSPIKNGLATYEKDTVVDIRNIIIDRDSVNIDLNNALIIKSYVITLDTNDTGISVLPQLYTNPNIEGATNQNILLPKTESSINYNDFRVYYGIQAPLTARLFINSQPLVEQIKFHHKYSSTLGVEPSTFYLPNQNLTLPGVNKYTLYDLQATAIKNPVFMEGHTNEGGKLFLDSSVFVSKSVDNKINHITRDVEITAFNYQDNPSSIATKVLSPFVTYDDILQIISIPQGGALDVNAPANTLEVHLDDDTDFIKTTVGTYNSEVTDFSNSALYTTYYFNGTVYEQGKLTLRLTSISGEVNEVSILTRPFYNRQGYYRKYNQSGYEDQDYVHFDMSLDESNDVQLTNFKKLIQRQFAKIVTPEITDPNSPAFGKSNLNSNMGYGVFNVAGNLNGQYNVDGQVRGFATSDTNGRGFFLNKTDGKIIIRADGTKGSSANKLNFNRFSAPGHILIQHRKVNSSTAKNADSIIMCVYSYQTVTTTSYGIYEFSGIKPVVGNLSYLESNSTLWPNIMIDLFFLDVSNPDAIELFPYGLPPITREIVITFRNGTGSTITSIDEYVSTPQVNQTNPILDERENSPSEPYFTLNTHVNKPKDSVGTISSETSNHRFFQYRKDYFDLLNEYTFYVINEFNKQFTLNDIKAIMRKGELDGELYIEYPDGQTIEIQNDYGSHTFTPPVNKPIITKARDSLGDDTIVNARKTNNFTKLSERLNNEYIEKNLIKWSRRNIPEISTPQLFQYIGRNDKSIIGAAANNDYLYIFKEDGIFRITDYGQLDSSDSLPNLSVQPITNTIICQASNSIQEINEEIIFLSQYGFMSLTGSSIQNISGPIDRDILELLSVSPVDRIKSYKNEDKNIYCCTLINETAPNLNVRSGTYVFNVKTRQWSFMDEEILAGIEDHDGRTIAAYRQRPIIAKLTDRVQTDDGIKPIFDFTETYSDNKLQRANETEPIDLFYISREQHTDNVKQNSVDQYDFKLQSRYEGSNTSKWIKKVNSTEFCIRTDYIRPNTGFRHKFSTSVEHAITNSVNDLPEINSEVSIVDSFVQLFANRTPYLIKTDNNISESYEIKITRTGFDNRNMLVFFEFLSTAPTWFVNMSDGYFNTGLTAKYDIAVGVPVKLTFNPESGSQPDTNKQFQEYMVHTETTNKSMILKFKTDSQVAYTKDRRFIYDNTATKRNIFRTYIPTNVSRGRYLIRQVKHDVPLENLIITGQTMVMRDTGNTRVQKDRGES